jgi:hypothetical protein
MTWVIVAVLLFAFAGAGFALLRPRNNSSAVSAGDAGKSLRGIDPFSVGEPWRQHVQAALSARRRMAEIIRASASGPIRDRLSDITTDVDRVVEQVWAIAVQGNTLAKADRRIDTDKTAAKLAELQQQLGGADLDARGPIEESIASLEATTQTGTRIAQQRESAAARLREMDIRLEELVARAAEVSTAGVEPDSVDTLRADMDALVVDLEGLRQGLDETRRTATQ